MILFRSYVPLSHAPFWLAASQLGPIRRRKIHQVCHTRLEDLPQQEADWASNLISYQALWKIWRQQVAYSPRLEFQRKLMSTFQLSIEQLQRTSLLHLSKRQLPQSEICTQPLAIITDTMLMANTTTIVRCPRRRPGKRVTREATTSIPSNDTSMERLVSTLTSKQK